MSEHDDGGSAFPEITTSTTDEYGNAETRVYSIGGMSLRDYFAGQALASLSVQSSHQEAATHAYRYADAMLKERSRS